MKKKMDFFRRSHKIGGRKKFTNNFCEGSPISGRSVLRAARTFVARPILRVRVFATCTRFEQIDIVKYREELGYRLGNVRIQIRALPSTLTLTRPNVTLILSCHSSCTCMAVCNCAIARRFFPEAYARRIPGVVPERERHAQETFDALLRVQPLLHRRPDWRTPSQCSNSD